VLRVPVAVAQVPVTWDISQNLVEITRVLAEAQPGEIVVLPEACVSGYDDNLSRLDQLDSNAVDGVVDRLAELAGRKGTHLFCGSLLFEHDAWWNAAIYLSPHGKRWTYRKINLATHERGRLSAGESLPTLRLDLDGGSLTAGVQLCREILFPEQWQQLADAGAQVFIYLTHAANPDIPAGVWRSHLISRAAANQRFVVAANVVDPSQHCPSAVISPRGEVLGELPASRAGILRAVIDTDEVASWYLDQRRTDLLHLHYRGNMLQDDTPECPVGGR
jgi:predicted amidohydrolase